MSIHPSAAYDLARLRHAESVARADRVARAHGFHLRPPPAEASSRLLRWPWMALRRRAEPPLAAPAVKRERAPAVSAAP